MLQRPPTATVAATSSTRPRNAVTSNSIEGPIGLHHSSATSLRTISPTGAGVDFRGDPLPPSLPEARTEEEPYLFIAHPGSPTSPGLERLRPPTAATD
jgi:hypothetical protein